MARSVYHFTDSQELGGAEHALLLLIENSDRRLWRSTLLYNPSAAVAPLVESARQLGAEVLPIPAMPLGLGGASRVAGLARVLRRARPSVFHAHLSWPLAAKYPLLAAVLARVPAVVATVQLYPEFRIDRSNYLQERALAIGVDRYIAVSRDIARLLTERLAWPRHKIDVIHNGVPVDRFQRPPDPELRDRLTGGADRPIILTAARLAPQKGLDVLLRAAVHVPGGQFVFAGEGPERPRLEAQAEKLGLDDRVLFLGRRSDVPELLAASDVFVLPSLFEGSSLAVLEAMAAGKPVVSSAIGGTDELVVDGESGLLVPPGDVGALALALNKVLSEAELRARLGARARDRVQTCFSASTAAARTTRVYEDLLDREGRHGGG
jgi:glycosyltransferase involved in cell wall biosynthesis